MQNKLIITTAVPVDDQFSGPKQIRWSAALGKLLVANTGSSTIHSRFASLLFSTKNAVGGYSVCVDADTTYLYLTGNVAIRKYDFTFSVISSALSLGNGGIRMIDASGDPDYVYVSSNNGTDHHGFRQVKKSDLTVTATALADGSGDGQFDDPLGIFYYNSEIFVADYDNSRISVWTKSGETLTYNRKYDLGFKPMDLVFDGTNWFVKSTANTYKYDNVFTDATKTSTACIGYSLTIIPDQSDGNGATLAISNSTSSCLYRRKCSDLSLIATVGSAGDGSSSLCDLTITGVAGTYRTSAGSNISAASGATPVKNGFTGIFEATTPFRVTFQPTGSLSSITAIDFNADAIQGEIKNLYKCVNLTSLKLQTNPALVLNLSRLTSKIQTLWAYACGAGISGSIRHMTALTSVNLRENAAGQAQADAWVEDLWANKDILVTPTINMNGTNSAPSGTFQYAENPSTPKEKIYSLINDYIWTFIFTA